MAKRTMLAAVLALILTMASCTDADLSRIGSIGSTFRITLYSGGQAVKTWRSTGKVLAEKDSDGWYFTDRETNKLVRVSGPVAVEQE